MKRKKSGHGIFVNIYVAVTGCISRLNRNSKLFCEKLINISSKLLTVFPISDKFSSDEGQKGYSASLLLRFYVSTFLRFYVSTFLRFYVSTFLRFYGRGLPS